jgi:predicted AlkP superfamily pyrophosphatase or phosphodiesterase
LTRPVVIARRIATVFAVVALASMACRTQRKMPPRVRTSHPVIFLGLDAADWSLLDDYMGRGVMPNLARLAAEGTSGHIKTLSPPLSPLVWTTMLTGTSPLDHGILDFVQFDPVTGQKQPITSSERRVPAVWNMATVGGKHPAVFGLWATFPAEAVDGLIVSDRLFTFLYKEQAPPPRVVFPANREAWARAMVSAAPSSRRTTTPSTRICRG